MLGVEAPRASASSSLSALTASMISSPSSWEAALTMSAICAGWSLAEFAIRDPQPRRGHVRDEWLDAVPVQDRPWPDPPVQLSGKQAAEKRPARRVDSDHPPLTVRLGKLDLVRAHQPDTHHVDQVAGNRSCASNSSPGRRSNLRRSTLKPVNWSGRSRTPILSTGTNSIAALDANNCAGDGRVADPRGQSGPGPCLSPHPPGRRRGA